MLHTSLIKSGILNIPKKVISFKNKWGVSSSETAAQDEMSVGWISYVILQGFFIFFGLCLLDWFLFYNISYLLASWMRSMSLIFLLTFIIFSGSDLLGIKASSNEYLHIKKSLTFLLCFLCVIIAGYNLKSSFMEEDALVSGALFLSYLFVSMCTAGIFLYYKHKWGYKHLIFKSLSAPLIIWGTYCCYSLYRLWF